MENKILDNLFLGSFLDANSSFEKYDIIIKLNEEWYYNTPPAGKIYHKVFPDREKVSEYLIDEIVETIESNYNEGKNILIHCFAGISRSPMITAAFLIKRGICNIENYEEFLVDKRDIVSIHPLLKKSLKEWYERYIKK